MPLLQSAQVWCDCRIDDSSNQMTDRLAGTNVSARERAKLLDLVRRTLATGMGTTSRCDQMSKTAVRWAGFAAYRNSRTVSGRFCGLIVGHSRTFVHTP